ncbi:MAG: hypothetical protein WBP81_33490 [Solirubrobacteraceae bacterium]
MNFRTARDGAQALAAALAPEGGTVAEVLLAPEEIVGVEDCPGPPQIAARGPRARGMEGEYELLLEMILEGARLHYGRPRVVAPENPDLALLLGDQLYALGLSRLAALGDLAATAELADVISLVAQAHARSDPDLADAVWEAGAIAVGWGQSDDLGRAKALARADDPGARGALRSAAAEMTQTAAVEPSDARLFVDDTLR